MEEDNAKIYYRKRLQNLLSCSWCPPNKIENRGRKNQFYRKHWSWKFRNKKKNQFIKSSRKRGVF